ncbi:hypothetical protein NS228_20985 [Methylobacterium indicum]|uniref:Uncharacterized protein n=1 Tax=Methylobacterium indicum TaxID=1775910 RepID=A0ABR5HH31_9HYPH|nr:hypothetical protein QR78_28295 [Methylobacterium indicum]KMO25893.1 hypothetical protein QR79_05500 [Methylobacterium indicum]KTS34746.1 hypothetical protein NS228_20985 [Methylobacterium indicum]KTS36005.1 hypothetical protein NS229_09900 [Methylobacterium indicum]KTS52640.1 hypothetical protein NS230_08985 [Methylobacterium indicum]
MSLRSLALLTGLIGLPAGAFAADPVYPPGSRFGFEPAKEMVVSRRFTGFERQSGGATVSVVELPAQAYKDLATNFTDENLKSQGLVVKTRETLKLADGREGMLVTGEQPIEQPAGAPALHKWVFLVADPTVTGIVIGQTLPGAESDEAMRAMLTSVRVRPALTIDQQVAALPFRVTDTAGFRPVRVLGGNSVLYTVGPKDQMTNLDQPILVLAEAVQPAPSTDQRDAFAKAALYSNQTMKDFAIERSQSYRQNGADWHEIVARAVDIPSGTPVVVSQTIRFQPDGYFRAVGVVRAQDRETMLPRFRKVVDTIAF